MTGKYIILTEPLPEALGAICSILPLDYFEEMKAMFIMAPQEDMDQPLSGVEVVSADGRDRMALWIRYKGRPDQAIHFMMSRQGFCFALIHTMERRPYVNVIVV